VIVPDGQCHPVAGISYDQFAEWFLFPSQLCRRAFDLDMDARCDRTILRGSANLREREQIHLFNLTHRAKML
jgi:hypothetical protein